MSVICNMTSSYKLKVLLCGSVISGKTELIKRFVNSRFQTDYKLTVGVDILTKDIELANDNICTLSIWDIGGQERFSFIRSTFYKGAAGAIIVLNKQSKETVLSKPSGITYAIPIRYLKDLLKKNKLI